MKISNTLISVIVPYYKKKNYIYWSLNSALKQSHKKIELIIIYDDENLSDYFFLKKIINKDKRVKLIKNKKNIHVLNAPSPAATACLAIGEQIMLEATTGCRQHQAGDTIRLETQPGRTHLQD